jgi:hypothetical protein
LATYRVLRPSSIWADRHRLGALQASFLGRILASRRTDGAGGRFSPKLMAVDEALGAIGKRLVSLKSAIQDLKGDVIGNVP